MNTCAAQIKAKQPTTACSPEVAAQAQDIARDSSTVAEATKDAAHPAGQDVVYWIAPENGAKKAATPHVFHICQGVSPMRGKTVNHGSVTEAYAENATRITKQIPMEQKQCGFTSAASWPVRLRFNWDWFQQFDLSSTLCSRLGWELQKSGQPMRDVQGELAIVVTGTVHAELEAQRIDLGAEHGCFAGDHRGRPFQSRK